MSKEKLVITINNEKLPLNKCRKFDAGYYKVGDSLVENSGDCYLINGKYYRMETGQVVFDNEVGQHVLRNDNMVNGIVGFNNDGYDLGFFTINKDKNIIVHTINGTYYCFNEELVQQNRSYRERLSNGEYYHISLIDAREFDKIKKPSQDYKTSLPYDSRSVLQDYIGKYEALKLEPQNSYVKNYAALLHDFSFGLEFETTAGFIPNRHLDKSGLIPLRDGSISGIEYVTVPLQGVKGLQAVINSCKLLNDRTIYDDTCSLHLHLGGIPRTKEFLLALFKLICATQDDLFSMFPLYKKYNFRIKNKNYSKPYPIYHLISQIDPIITPENLDKNFDILFQYLSMGHSMKNYDNDLKNVNDHPADPNNNQKWNIRTRYYVINLIPLIFGNKTTVEFRIHTPTFNVNKIIPFMIMNASVIQFCKKHTKRILEDPKFLTQLNLKAIVADTISHTPNVPNLNSVYESVLSYLDNRTYTTENQNKRGLIKGEETEHLGAKGIDYNKIIIKRVPKAKEEINESLELVTDIEEETSNFEGEINDSKGLAIGQWHKQTETWVDFNKQLQEAQSKISHRSTLDRFKTKPSSVVLKGRTW